MTFGWLVERLDERSLGLIMLLLALALAAAVVSLAGTAATIWATVYGIEVLEGL